MVVLRVGAKHATSIPDLPASWRKTPSYLRGTAGSLVRAAALACRRPVLLAGGLTPSNVAEAIAAVRPAGVDVSSGVEEAPGVKSAERVAEFLANARAAFERL